jgi:hypothetical protein
MDHVGKKANTVRPVITAIVFALGIVMAGCFITALLINREVVAMDSLGYWVMGILFLAGLVGGIIIVAIAKEKILIQDVLWELHYFSFFYVLVHCFLKDHYPACGKQLCF